MKTNQSERERSINVTPNDHIVTNNQALKISLSEQLKNVKRQKKEEFYQFKSKQPIDNNTNESSSKLKHQGLYLSGTTVIVGDSIINGVIEERINKKDRAVKVQNFPGATVADMEHYLIPIIQKKPSNIILHVGKNNAKNLPSRTVLDNLLKLKALVKDSLPTRKVFISTQEKQEKRSNMSLTTGFPENLRWKNKDRPIIAQLNINFLRNKFGFLSSQITKYVEILFLSETKLDDSFPTGQFSLNGYSKPYRFDRSSNGGDILLYVRDEIPSRLLTDYKIKDNLELFFVEVNIRKKKWLLSCSYNPHKSNISNHLHHLNKGLDVYLKSYDNILIIGDFNSEFSENCLNGFCNVNSLKTLNRGPTCFKNPSNPSCIDLFLTNRQQGFQQTHTIETGIFNLHKMVVTVMKTHYKKQKAETI